MDVTRDDFTGYTALTAAGPLFKPDVTVGGGGGGWVDESQRVVRKNRDFRSQAVGLYAQDLVQVAPAWKLLAGLRWDRFEGRYRTLSTANADLGAVSAERSRADALWSHRTGLPYQPTPLSSFHLSYGTRFNASGDAYQYDALGSNTPPEHSRNVELGAKIDSDSDSDSGNATLPLALFHATKFNERNRDDTSVSPTHYVLSGRRHAAGVEVDVAGRLTP